mmetsp:Transcript_3655/g.6388  ORF Transcript_3655/g.6388 Transcript_3655/m.6388 type:complete len:293 (-) Transcript_3655:2279-3157(-)
MPLRVHHQQLRHFQVPRHHPPEPQDHAVPGAPASVPSAGRGGGHDPRPLSVHQPIRCLDGDRPRLPGHRQQPSGLEGGLSMDRAQRLPQDGYGESGLRGGSCVGPRGSPGVQAHTANRQQFAARHRQSSERGTPHRPVHRAVRFQCQRGTHSDILLRVAPSLADGTFSARPAPDHLQHRQLVVGGYQQPGDDFGPADRCCQRVRSVCVGRGQCWWRDGQHHHPLGSCDLEAERGAALPPILRLKPGGRLRDDWHVERSEAHQLDVRPCQADLERRCDLPEPVAVQLHGADVH